MSEDDHEHGYELGSRMAWTAMLGQCLMHLGHGNREDLKAERLIYEREQAIVALRMVCKDHGDNDWEATLHLADIIQKHLARHLPDPDDGEPDKERGA